MEEINELLSRLPLRQKEIVEKMLKDCYDFGVDRGGSVTSYEEFISSVEDFVVYFEETSLEESLTREKYN